MALLITGVFFAALTNTANGVANILFLAASLPNELYGRLHINIFMSLTYLLQEKLKSVPSDSLLLSAWIMETARVGGSFIVGAGRVVQKVRKTRFFPNRTHCNNRTNVGHIWPNVLIVENLTLNLLKIYKKLIFFLF